MTSNRIIPAIQFMLAEFVENFEATLDLDNITAKEYWEKVFLKLGKSINKTIATNIGLSTEYDSGRCSEIVLSILQNFDEFCIEHPSLHFPSKNLGRCRIHAMTETGKILTIPHFKLSTNQFLDWKYHEIIIILDDEDLVNTHTLLSNSMIYDIQMNQSRILTLRGFVKDFIPTQLLRMFKPDIVIPDSLTFRITHRLSGVAIECDKWRNLENRTSLLTKNWYS